jgi:hypothetical protein
MVNFADMEQTVFNYEDENIRLVTTFEDLARLDTASLEGYMILACDNGRIDVDVNGARQHLETFEALILPPRTRLSNCSISI